MANALVAVTLRLPPELYIEIEQTRLLQTAPQPKKGDWVATLLRRGLSHTRRPKSAKLMDEAP
jgi:hypothetical protein